MLEFFSPDPFVQSAGDWLNYDRYSYVMNNPTRYTDPSGYVFEHDNDPKPLLNRLTPWVFRKVTPRQYENSISNAYFYLGNGQYCNFNGNLVPFDEVLHNYLIPGSTYISSDNNPFSVANDMKDGWRCFNFRAFGKDNFMLVKGALGSISPEPNGAIIFSNSTASVTTLSDWGFTDESGQGKESRTTQLTSSYADFVIGATEAKIGAIFANRTIYGKALPETVIRTPLTNINISTRILQNTGVVLKWGGRTFGALGLAETYLQWQTGSIGNEEAILDGAFGIAGFIPEYGWAIS